MTSSRFGTGILVAALACHAACTDTESATNLNPGGPPMIEQVIMTESVIDMAGNENDSRVFAFGTLPSASPDMEHAVSSAAVAQQHLRIVFDELLKGNAFEEISCRASVGPDGAFDRVPDGTTPDDIARCATAQDVLKATCTGSHAVCLCQLDGGCIVGSDSVAKGQPVGVLDVNLDGAADMHRFIPTSVGLKCGGMTINADAARSYWYPSGDQLPPAQGGIEEIGPALVFYPSGSIPTNTNCNLVFDPGVVDKTNNQVCAPVGGRTTECAGNLDKCTQTCTPGDVSAFTFKTAPLALAATFDKVGVDKTLPLIFVSNTTIDMATLMGAITMTEGGASFTAFTASLMGGGGRSQVYVTPNAGTWKPNTTYTITFSTALKDSTGVPVPAPLTFTFTTGA